MRSSATAEDLPSASFAGQQDTYLNIVGVESVLDAVRRCWASLWTDRAVSYREEAGIDHRDVSLSVVVQRMLDAELAGVLFTADPLTGRRSRTVIDAAQGWARPWCPERSTRPHRGEGDGTIAEYGRATRSSPSGRGPAAGPRR